ncbi:MAG: hypothetical protein ACTSPS_19405 [Promethearchaeota archaeon]
MEIDELKESINNLNNTINNLKESINLKDDQINTIKDSLKLKEDQIKTLESSLNLKEDKILALEKTLELKEEQINSTTLNNEKDKKIKDLQKEIELLNNELTKADEDLGRMELEIEKLKKGHSDSSNSKIIDYTNIEILKEVLLKQMRDILQKSLHSVTIIVPNISDLQELHLYEVRAGINMKVCCEIDPEVEEQIDQLEEYESLDNKNIRIFNSLVMEAWLRSRPFSS